MEILIKAGQFILSLSILVTLHELGHFIPAKLFKTRVDKFYLFFDFLFPLPSVLNFSLFKKKIGDTEYGLGWFPMGGYVKIAGMVDESMDKEQMALPPQPYEFRSKPAWQRLIIMLGGVTVNLVLAVIIFAMILFTWGESYLPAENAKYGVMCDSLGYQLGLKNGDKILALDGKAPDRFYGIQADILIEQTKIIKINRNGTEMDIKVPSDFTKIAIEKNPRGYIMPRLPLEIGGFAPSGVAEKGGLKLNDKIIGLNNQALFFFDEFKFNLQKFKNKPVQITVLRGKDTVNIILLIPSTGLIGIMPKGEDFFFKMNTKEYGFFESFPAGINKATQTLSGYIKQLKLIFDPEVEGYKQIGGFISMGKIFPGVWDWQAFWSLTAFLSVVLAFMNVLPIPALDGGHALFTLYEMITGRKPSDKFLEYAQYLGMALLFTLLIYANGNDLFRLFGLK